MITLHTFPSKNYVNKTFNTVNLNLASFVDVPTCGGILVRLEIESINGQFIITDSMDKPGTYLGGSTNTYTQIGRYELGFGRGDFDDSTTISISVQIIGTARINATIYSVAKGEGVLEWL